MSRLSRMHVGFGALVLAASVILAPAGAWSQPASPEDWAAPRTAWGDPDIGGVWNSSTVTPLERPEALADKAFLTAEEAAAIEQRVVDANARANAPSVVRTEPLPVGGNVGGYNSFWLDRGTTVVPTRRTSLVIDPPNGRLPALTPEAEAHVTSPERQRLKDIREGLVPADSHEQFDYGDRCIWYRGVPSLPTAYNNNYHLVQTPDVIAIVQEHIHDVRFIHLDGRPAIDEGISQFGGHSRGRWEGDTLVVETTNFGNPTCSRPAPDRKAACAWDHPSRRPAGDRRGHQPVRRPFARALGGRHARRRDDQLRQPGLPVLVRPRTARRHQLGSQPGPARRGAVHPRGAGDARLPVHGGRSERLDPPVDRLVAVGPQRPADVRVRLPRGQLRPDEHPRRLARRGGAEPRPLDR